MSVLQICKPVRAVWSRDLHSGGQFVSFRVDSGNAGPGVLMSIPLVTAYPSLLTVYPGLHGIITSLLYLTKSSPGPYLPGPGFQWNPFDLPPPQAVPPGWAGKGMLAPCRSNAGTRWTSIGSALSLLSSCKPHLRQLALISVPSNNRLPTWWRPFCDVARVFSVNSWGHIAPPSNRVIWG